MCTVGKMGSRYKVVTWMETFSYGSVGWNPLVWVCHVLYYFPIVLSQVSHLSGCTHVCIYACTCMGAFVCVRNSKIRNRSIHRNTSNRKNEHRQSHIRDAAEVPNLGTYSDWGLSSVLVTNKYHIKLKPQRDNPQIYSKS